MSLPAITEAMCKAVARRDFPFALTLANQAAAHMGGERGLRIRKELGYCAENQPALKHWQLVTENRCPWVPPDVDEEMRAWLHEAINAKALVEAGEKVMPIMLVGETRCGKTSSLCVAAIRMGIPVYRFAMAKAIGSFLGDCAKKIEEAFMEPVIVGSGLWLIDEIEGATPYRRGGSGGEQERTSAVATILTELDNLPTGVLLAATSNTADLIDKAVLGRFRVVEFPSWEKLGDDERMAFAKSHGCRVNPFGESYADVVKAARSERVRALIGAAP